MSDGPFAIGMAAFNFLAPLETHVLASLGHVAWTFRPMSGFPSTELRSAIAMPRSIAPLASTVSPL